MGKRFKQLKLLRIIPYFDSCRNKDSTTLPSNRVPSFLRHSSSLNPINPSSNRHVSSSSFSCGPCASTRSKDDVIMTTNNKMQDVYIGAPGRTRSPPPTLGKFHWEREEEYWHVVAELLDGDGEDSAPRRKICSSSSDSGRYDVVLPPRNTENDKKKKKKKKKQKKKKTIGIRMSTSSEEDETEGLCKSNNNNNYYNYYGNAKKKRSSRRRRQEWRGVESYVVVKRSDDPRGDFRWSMMEMILEKQMLEERDLEQLLISFLSLNSCRYYPLIVLAFLDICHLLFLPPRTSSSSSVSASTNRLSFAVYS